MSAYFSLLALVSAATAPPPAALPGWTADDARQLLAVVESARGEGLDSRDYEPERLRRALNGADPEALATAATESFVRLASDFSQGHAPASARVGWHFPSAGLGDEAGRSLMAGALVRHDVKETLQSLLPANADYQVLKSTLEKMPENDRAGILALRVNLDRWRWMPRSLGDRYLLVNVPAFEVSLIDHGTVVERHKVIVGKTTKPTPQFGATVQAVLLNPWWEVPPSIAAEGIGALVRTNPAAARVKGYVSAGGRIRQRPGPANALGQLKLVMPNAYTVYLHDTPNKELFAEQVRGFSHGCIRTEGVVGLAAAVLDDPSQWSSDALTRTITAGATKQVPLSRPLPVYITYFTAAAGADGRIASYPDIYGRDGPVIAALTDRDKGGPLAIGEPVATPLPIEGGR